MKIKKILCVCLAMSLTAGALAGCGTKKENGKVNVSIGLWPDETQQEELEKKNKMKEEFMSENPDINIIPDTYAIDSKTFVLKAAAGQLPNAYHTWFTEIQPNIKAGYATEITEMMDKYGYSDNINPKLRELIEDEEGRLYGIPTTAYVQGLFINKKLFKEAGLVNADGSVKIPKTYQEMAEFAQIIKEKTGKAGFVMPTTNNIGGWHFLNIAWSFGAEFAKQRDDGTWEATFNTQEARDALQYVKDLKWKYNALSDEAVIGFDDMQKYFATYQAGMFFSDPPCQTLFTKYGMAHDDLCVAKLPEGPAGRYAQTGGTLWMFSKETTREQQEAAIKWLKYTGVSPEITDEEAERKRMSYEDIVNQGGIVMDKDAIDLWSNPETLAKESEIRKAYVNVDRENFKDYYDMDGVTINPEPILAQELYAVLDKCIQEVITNKDADVAKLIESACSDFQLNHLDKMD